MKSVFDLARYLLDTVGGRIPTVKLQKLCYYCQAWTLAKLGRPLFREEFEKWVNGPVCRELYKQHRGQFDVSDCDIPDELLSGEEFAEDELGVIEDVICDYGGLSGDELSALTHREDPWRTTKNLNDMISKNCIMNFYFDLWGNESRQEIGSAVIGDDDIAEAAESAKKGVKYDSAVELFREL